MFPTIFDQNVMRSAFNPNLTSRTFKFSGFLWGRESAKREVTRNRSPILFDDTQLMIQSLSDSGKTSLNSTLAMPIARKTSASNCNTLILPTTLSAFSGES